MDEHKIKRLAIMLAMAIIVIFIAKFLLTKTIDNMGKAAADKRPLAVVQTAPEPVSEAPLVAPLSELPASAVEDSSAPASAPSVADPDPALR